MRMQLCGTVLLLIVSAIAAAINTQQQQPAAEDQQQATLLSVANMNKANNGEIAAGNAEATAQSQHLSPHLLTADSKVR